MAAAQYYEQVQQAYLAYYGRPADPAGQAYWANQLNLANGNMNAIINAFGTSAESTALYGSSSQVAQVNAIYNTLFGRNADTAGLNFYVNGLNNGTYTLASIALNVYNGATGADAADLTAKLAYADAFTLAVAQTTQAQVAYTGTAAATNARAAVALVVNTASEATQQAAIPTTVANIGGGAVAQAVMLTTGADNVTGSNIVGSLTDYNVDGKGPTLNYNDVIAGTAGSTNNTLTLHDDYSQSNDVIPLGVSISNIQNIVLQTSGNAGSNQGGTVGQANTGGYFDTSSIAGVTNVTVTSNGSGSDNVKAATTTAINVTHQNGSGLVNTLGGSTVTVNTNGAGVNIGSRFLANANPTGAIVVNEAGVGSTVIFGGTTVNVTDTAPTGSIQVGTNLTSVSPANATGVVTINATTGNLNGLGVSVIDYAGTDANITSAGGAVTVGGFAGVAGIVTNGQAAVVAPTGNITITDTAAVPLSYAPATNSVAGFPAAVTVVGGNNVSITTNAGSVSVGAANFNGSVAVAGQNPAGNVTVVDTASVSTIAASNNADVTVYGGANVNVQDAGGNVTIGNVNGNNVVAPSGTITVTDTSQVAYDNVLDTQNRVVNVTGGTTVNVTTNAGNVVVGSTTGVAGSQPTGAVTVVDSSLGNVWVYGGTNDTITAAGGAVTVGNGTALTNATGNLTVTQSAVETGGQFGSSVTVNGGANVTVNTTGGSVTAGVTATPVTGAVAITDTFVGTNGDTFTVVGGKTVAINTTATNGSISVGNVAPQLNVAGTALLNGAAYANGNVTIVNESLAGTTAAGSANVFGTGTDVVNTNGATSVSITGGSGGTITDEQTTLATGGVGAGKAIGTSTLATVALDGVSGTATINSGALTNLSVADSSATAAASTAVTVNETGAHALALTLANDAVTSTLGYASVTDGSATSVTVSTTGTAASTVALSAAKATALTFNNAAAVSLATPMANPSNTASASLISDAALTTVTATGAGALNLGNLSGFTKLTTINATGSTGGVTVGINSGVTSFNGAGSSGNDTITLSQNSTVNTANNAVNDTIVGGSGVNTLVANYIGNIATDVALGNNASIKGFTNLAIGTAGSGSFDASGFSGLSVGNTAGAVSFQNVAAGATLSLNPAIQAGTDTLAQVTYLLKNSAGTNDTLSLNVGTDGTTQYQSGTVLPTAGSNSITATVATTGIENLKVNSMGYVSPAGTAAASVNVNTVTINDTGAKTVTVTGDQNLNLTLQTDAGTALTGSAVTAINASAATGAVNVAGVALASAGGTVTGGTGLLTASGETGTAAVAQVDTVTFSGTFAAGDTIKEVINGVTYTATDALGTAAGAATALAAAITAPGVTAAAVGATMTLTANTAGTAFTSAAAVDSTTATGISTDVTTTNNEVVGATGVDTITTGTGGGVIAVGTGGSWIAVAGANNNGAYGSGSETINLGASTGVVDTINVNDGAVATFNGTKGGVNGFQVTANAATSDKLNFTTPGSTPVALTKTALANVSTAKAVSTLGTTVGGTAVTAQSVAYAIDATGALYTALQNLTYTATNGVITFSATGGHQLSDFTSAQLVSAAEIIVNLSGASQVAAFSTGGNTYVVTDDALQTLAANGGNGTTLLGTANHTNLDTITDLVGVTGVTGFGSTAAVGTVVAADVTNVIATSATTGTLAAQVYNEAGFSHASLGVVGLGQLAGTTSTVLNNLAASSVIDLTGNIGASLGNLTVTQQGAAGSDSLTLNFTTNASTLGTVTLTGDNALTIAAGNTAVITSLVDTGNTLATITVTGSNSLNLNGVTDTALTKFDASADTSSLNLGTATTALSQAGLTIKGALGGDIIFASGAGDVITIGDATHPITTGNIAITANGLADTITVTNDAAAGTNTFAAAASGDTISVDLGNNTIGGVINGLGAASGSLGSGDTINLATTAGTDNVWLGGNSTVNLGTAATPFAGTANLTVTGDLTGAGTSGTYAQTLINGAAAPGFGHLTIAFNNVNAAGGALNEVFAGGSATASQVNVASATTLAQALNLAASQASVMNAQGANAAIPLTGAAVGTAVLNGVLQEKASTGLIDYFHFAGNTYVVEVNNASTSVNAAHPALGAGDVVVELTGNVNLSAANFAGHILTVH
jgi:hypothetical protein